MPPNFSLALRSSLIRPSCGLLPPVVIAATFRVVAAMVSVVVVTFRVAAKFRVVATTFRVITATFVLALLTDPCDCDELTETQSTAAARCLQLFMRQAPLILTWKLHPGWLTIQKKKLRSKKPTKIEKIEWVAILY